MPERTNKDLTSLIELTAPARFCSTWTEF